MPWTSKHVVNWLKKTSLTLNTKDGRPVEVWEFNHINDDAILSEWATHFRNHYCLDTEIDDLRSGYGFTRSRYLTDLKFPDSRKKPGPSIRSGDFAEILVADFLEFILQYWVPRHRYSDKTVRDESKKGSDVVGFKIFKDGHVSPDDTLAIFETKARLRGANGEKYLQKAIDDSGKDDFRRAESLNAIKQRLLEKSRKVEAKRIERFQNPVDRPYKEVFGAAAVIASTAFNGAKIAETDTSKHPSSKQLSLVIIHGPELMKLAHALYRRAADEA